MLIEKMPMTLLSVEPRCARVLVRDFARLSALFFLSAAHTHTHILFILILLSSFVYRLSFSICILFADSFTHHRSTHLLVLCYITSLLILYTYIYIVVVVYFQSLSPSVFTTRALVYNNSQLFGHERFDKI